LQKFIRRPLHNLRCRRLRLRKRISARARFVEFQRSTMTTSPDTVHAAEATTDAARLTAQPAGQATSPATPAPAGTVGGTVDPTATRTRVRPARPDFEEEQTSGLQR